MLSVPELGTSKQADYSPKQICTTFRTAYALSLAQTSPAVIINYYLSYLLGKFKLKIKI